MHLLETFNSAASTLMRLRGATWRSRILGRWSAILRWCRVISRSGKWKRARHAGCWVVRRLALWRHPCRIATRSFGFGVCRLMHLFAICRPGRSSRIVNLLRVRCRTIRWWRDTSRWTLVIPFQDPFHGLEWCASHRIMSRDWFASCIINRIGVCGNNPRASWLSRPALRFRLTGSVRPISATVGGLIIGFDEGNWSSWGSHYKEGVGNEDGMHCSRRWCFNQELCDISTLYTYLGPISPPCYAGPQFFWEGSVSWSKNRQIPHAYVYIAILTALAPLEKFYTSMC